MKTIEALEQDILLQVPFLHRFKAQKPIPMQKQQKSIICGTGDSYAAALLGEAFSDYRTRAIGPLDLINNQNLAKNHVYLVSISGNTISNIRAAKIAKSATAITANKNSRLAKACSKIIFLDYPSSGVFTSGSIGFLSSALTCMSLATKLSIDNPSQLFLDALAETRKIKIKNKAFFLGNQYTFPVSMYAAAKLYEILGIDAHYERIEQFSHMGLFSAKKGDTVIVFEQKNRHNLQLVKNLKKIGLNTILVEPKTNDKVSAIIFFIFVSQLVPLYHAKARQQNECYFINAKKIRAASSDMIY
ncbi:MAG: sugar isomerase [Thaumarchaeota archaeon]|nr:sugar isomerase [Nitrososphaerota archaeon]